MNFFFLKKKKSIQTIIQLDAEGSYEKQMRSTKQTKQTTDTSRVQECQKGHLVDGGDDDGGVILSSSTSNVSVELGGITGANPREPYA